MKYQANILTDLIMWHWDICMDHKEFTLTKSDMPEHF